MQLKDEYTVNEVAELLQTNPETVRKWIRDRKLKATPGNSKKEGIRIDDSSLQSFLDENTKYSKKAITSATAALLTGGLAIPAFLMVKAYKENQTLASAIISSSDLLDMLEDEINQENDLVLGIQEKIHLLELEIKKRNERISSIQNMILELKGDNAVKKHNKTKTVSRHETRENSGASSKLRIERNSKRNIKSNKLTETDIK